MPLLRLDLGFRFASVSQIGASPGRTGGEETRHGDEHQRGCEKTSTTTTGERREWRGATGGVRGFIRRDSNGEDTYYIDKQIEGRRFTVSTRSHDEKDADKEWWRFYENPAAYEPPRRVVHVEGALVLDEKLAARFLDWSQKERHNSTAWVACQRQQLAWRAERWGNTKLRVEGGDEAKRRWLKEHVQKPLEGTKAAQQRVAVLSAFFTWLRKNALELSPSTDPTFGMLARPAPYKPSSTKVAITEERFREIRAEMTDGPYRWAFDVLMGTGRHAREIRAFASSGTSAIEPLPQGRPNNKEGLPLPAAVLVFGHTKAGVPAWIAASAEVAESARKLLAHGDVPKGKNGRGWESAIHDACEAADVKAGRVPAKFIDAEGSVRPELRDEVREKHVKLFHPGWARRTVRTFAGNKGASGPECDDFLGHAKGTGERNYGRHKPMKIPTMI